MLAINEVISQSRGQSTINVASHSILLLAITAFLLRIPTTKLLLTRFTGLFLVALFALGGSASFDTRIVSFVVPPSPDHEAHARLTQTPRIPLQHQQ